MTHVYSDALKKGTTIIINGVTIIGTKDTKKQTG